MGDFGFDMFIRSMRRAMRGRMNTLIIHGGIPKTGTSSLQVFFARNRGRLIERGVDYLPIGDFASGNAGLISTGNGVFVARSLLPDGNASILDDPAPHLGAFEQAVAASACETFLLSSEYFANADPARLKNWVEELRARGIAARLVYFIRAQDQLLSAMYTQFVKRSHCRETADEFAARVYKDRPHLRHASFHAGRCEGFGATNVRCLIYEETLTRPNGLFLMFLEAAGIDPAGLNFELDDVNTGLSAAEIAIMRRLNKYRPEMRFSDLLVQNARLAGMVPGNVHRLLSAEMLNEVRAFFAGENAELARRCFGREQLFPCAEEAGPASVAPVSLEEAIDVLGGLLVRYDERLTALESALARLQGT
jgi:hypothetical protein